MIIVERRTIKGDREDILRTIDPVKAEAHYFNLCKYYTIQEGSTIIIKSDTDEVPNANYKCGSIWFHERKELNQDRFEMIWATPQEKWRTPTIYMMKGLKKNILNDKGNQASAEWICSHLGYTQRAWYLWVNGSEGRRHIRFTDWNFIKSLAGL